MAGSTDDRLQAGILAARQGRSQEAKELLASVVVSEPGSELAWLWLGKVLSSPDQCAECFRRVLAINPQNQEANQLLMDLIRPDLSFMPKPPAAGPVKPAPRTPATQAFTSETEGLPLAPAPAGEQDLSPSSPASEAGPASVSPFDEGPVQQPPGSNADSTAPEPPTAQLPYVPPFDEPIGEEEDVLTIEDRAALAAEADQRVMGKTVETAPIAPAAPPEPAPVETPLQPPVETFVVPTRPSSRKGNGSMFAIGGFFLALFLLGLPALLASRNAALLDRLAGFFQPSPAVQPTAQPPLATSTAPAAVSPSPVPAVVPSSTPEPPKTYTRRLESVHADILRGQNLIQSQKYAEAILVWDNVLAVVPEDSDSHYQRGLAYLDLAEQPPRSLEEYKGYLLQARSDLDQAVAIGPVKGEYYLARHRDLIDLALLEADHAQRVSLLEMALADAQNAIQLGILFEKGLDRRPANVMLAMDQCPQALNFLLGLKEPAKTELSDEAGEHIDLARAYLCTGQVDQALSQVSAAEKLRPGDRIYWIKALALYNKSLLPDTLAVLDDWIKREPYTNSPRYALRALVHYDLGQPDKAGTDLLAAGNEGFDLTGLATYVAARLALDSGDQATGAALLAEADTYVPPEFGLIARRIHQDYRRVKGQTSSSAPAP